MTSTTPPETPKTWLERLSTDETSKQLDAIHPEFINLFKIENGDKLDENARAKILDSITKIDTTAILLQSPVNGEMMLLHQLNKVGGTIINKTTEYFGLFGDSNNAIPMKFNETSILHANEVECPSWATLIIVTTEDEVELAKDANACPTFMTSAMPLPPFITKHLIHLNSPTAAQVYVETQLAAKIFDREKGPLIPASSATLKTLLPFLWSAHHKKIQSVPTTPSVSDTIKQKCKVMHEIFASLSPESTPNTSNNTNGNTDPSVFESMNASLEQIVASTIMAQSATGTQNKKSFENRCNATFQTLILTASAKNTDTIPSEPSETSRAFFEQKNAAEAKAYVFHKLNM